MASYDEYLKALGHTDESVETEKVALEKKKILLSAELEKLQQINNRLAIERPSFKDWIEARKMVNARRDYDKL